jgi:hypothetical protein
MRNFQNSNFVLAMKCVYFYFYNTCRVVLSYIIVIIVLYCNIRRHKLPYCDHVIIGWH